MLRTIGKVEELMIETGELSLIEAFQMNHQLPPDDMLIVKCNQVEEKDHHGHRSHIEGPSLVFDAKNQEPDGGHQGHKPKQ